MAKIGLIQVTVLIFEVIPLPGDPTEIRDYQFIGDL